MWESFLQRSQQWAPALIVISLGLVVVVISHRYLQKKHQLAADSQLGFVGPMLTFCLLGIVVVTTILLLPIGDAARGQLFGLLGLLVTGAIALSSTTFLGNAMAGIMLRAIRHFRPGDYVKVGDHVGRVSDLGILHTEIQTEDRDLTTLPNLYLVTHPLTVRHASGTVVSAIVSLGYDVDHHTVEKLLVEAAKRAGLSDPFVHVTELGDYSIVYRASGFLEEVKHLMTTRSNLRKAMLDTLHEAGVEIVSPAFMNQRQQKPSEVCIPKKSRPTLVKAQETPAPEERIFDKADAAEAKEKLLSQVEKQRKKVEELRNSIAKSEFTAEKEALTDELAHEEKRLDSMRELLNEPEEVEEKE